MDTTDDQCPTKKDVNFEVDTNEDILDLEEFFDREEDVKTKSDGDTTPVKKKKHVNRVKWSKEEEDEIRKYLGNFLATKTTPSKPECLRAIAQSKEHKGKLQLRYWHTIVKKISNMNKKH